MGVEVVRSGHRIFEQPERVAAGARANRGAGGEPAGVFDLAYLYASTGESGSRRAGAGAGGLCLSAAGEGRRRSRRGTRNLRPDEEEPAENAEGVGGCGEAAGEGRRRSRRGSRNLRPDEKEPAENAEGVAGCGTPGDDRADGKFDLARSAAFAGGGDGECGISLRE